MKLTNEAVAKALVIYVKDKDNLSSIDNKIIITNVTPNQSIELKLGLFNKDKLKALGQSANKGNKLHGIIFEATVGIISILKKSFKKPVAKKKTQKVKANQKFVFPEHKQKKGDHHYSYSKRNTFLDSPRDYFYSYLFKMDKKIYGIQPKKKKSAFFIGGVFHDLLELYYTSIQLGFKVSDAYKIAKTDFNINWTEDKKREIEKITYKDRNYLMDLNDAEAYFDHYYFQYKDNDFDEVMYAEVSFMSELYEYDDEDLKGHHFYQHIKADLLVRDKGVYKLVEHKTHGSDRTAKDRISPQTLEYVEGIQKELGIEIKYIVFNEIRKKTPSAYSLLKSGKVSTAKSKLINFSKIALDKQLAEGIIDEEVYQDGLRCVNMDYYFHREQIPVFKETQKNFSLEMKYATKALARSLVKEQAAIDAGKPINMVEYPLIWSSNRRYGSDFEPLYMAYLSGFDQEAMRDMLFESYQPKDLSYQQAPSESPVEKINRLAALI